MFKKTLHRQLYLSYLLITLLSLGAIGGYTVSALHNFYYEQTSNDLKSRARLIQYQATHHFTSTNIPALKRLAKTLGQPGGQRVTLILPDGTVVGDSNENPTRMDNHSDRPEVKEALTGETGSSVRYSQTVKANLMYVALPISANGQLMGVVRLSIPLTVIDEALKGMLWKIILAGLLIALAATPVSLYISRRISQPLSEMKDNAERFASGKLDSRIRVEGPDDVVRLAEALNAMAAQLDDRIHRLRKLETIRRDFVANVSHELKTPITSIKGFVETLLGGALDNPEDSKRFLGIVAGQADRLNAIIDDLLSLSQLEQDSGGVEIVIEESGLKPVLEMAIQGCALKASGKNISVIINCEASLTARINPQLFEQAVINLVDNAIKYSLPSTQVRVEASAGNGEVTVAVIDEGRGIEKEHFPRIFERFYRVDKDRSRQLGGTGLGLAIVKHIAQVHGGSVSVDSSVGKGSTFRIHLPAKKPS
jgi:two-component system phosphate regulon sensor histidine kinase PhoR